ncbi:hypothetical protein SDC9_83802 [bioreactor metagenome]|uniref:PcfJ-like protein n=1 Tax=bioreactor metagenome TaxID=1076179 RepID=A0A644Z8H2_9ZZZZ
MEATMELTNTVKLQDYIIDLSGPIAKGTAEYEVVLQNNTDFIVKRRTLKTERELVILVSKGLYYIKDCKTGGIDPVTDANLRTFLRELKVGVVAMEQVHWMPHLFYESADAIFRVVSDAVLTDMCRHNVMDNMPDPYWFKPYWEQNSKLFMRLHKLFPRLTEPQKYQSSIPIIFWLEKTYGANEAIYFAEQLVKSGLRNFSTARSDYDKNFQDITPFTALFEADYNLNLRRFVDYLLFDLYRQGYAAINRSFMSEYADYLRMQKNFFGKIKEKYPEHFKTAHDVMALKVNLVKEVEQCHDFEGHAQEIRHLAYQGRDYCVVIPTQPKELADEGINLSHCVGDYIGRVASGECHILFLRRRATPDLSLVTLQLTGKRICQAQGMNRRDLTQEERKFLLRWGVEKEIDIAV